MSAQRSMSLNGFGVGSDLSRRLLPARESTFSVTHRMVNYDLPWHPNRIEQRFGRIHRIGQTEVCHLWNLVGDETRVGDVYHTLLEKLDEARKALGGQAAVTELRSK